MRFGNVCSTPPSLSEKQGPQLQSIGLIIDAIVAIVATCLQIDIPSQLKWLFCLRLAISIFGSVQLLSVHSNSNEWEGMLGFIRLRGRPQQNRKPPDKSVLRITIPRLCFIGVSILILFGFKISFFDDAFSKSRRIKTSTATNFNLQSHNKQATCNTENELFASATSKAFRSRDLLSVISIYLPTTIQLGRKLDVDWQVNFDTGANKSRSISTDKAQINSLFVILNDHKYAQIHDCIAVSTPFQSASPMSKSRAMLAILKSKFQ